MTNKGGQLKKVYYSINKRGSLVVDYFNSEVSKYDLPFAMVFNDLATLKTFHPNCEYIEVKKTGGNTK